MRLYHIHPAAFPTALLGQQHQTCHLLMTCVAEGRGTGGMLKYDRYLGFVVWMHYNLVTEMAVRGMRHDSPVGALWAKVPANRRAHNLWVSPVTYVADLGDLKAKLSSPKRGPGMDDARMDPDRGVGEFRRAHGVMCAHAVLPPYMLTA